MQEIKTNPSNELNKKRIKEIHMMSKNKEQKFSHFFYT